MPWQTLQVQQVIDVGQRVLPLRLKSVQTILDVPSLYKGERKKIGVEK